MKKRFVILFSLFTLIFPSLTSLVSATYHISECDPNDFYCQMDCDLDTGICGGSDTPPPDLPPCPAGQIRHETAQTCIYANESICRQVYGDAIWNGNADDGCACAPDATYNQATKTCEGPQECAYNEIRHANGNCIYADDSVCKAVYGEAFWNGNENDGCECLEGAVYNHDSLKCEFPRECPPGQMRHETARVCIYDSDATCKSVYGEGSYWDGNENDGCGCYADAPFNRDTGLCEYADDCPQGEMMHENGNCIYESDAVCEQVYGDGAYWDGNGDDGCRCYEEAPYNQETGKCEWAFDCPEGMMLRYGQEGEDCIYDSDEMCATIYGAAYFNEDADDGCVCAPEATWDGVSCVVSNVTINVDPGDFYIDADGEATQEIRAWATDDAGDILEYPMWIKIQTPNFISSGYLDIDSGTEGAGDLYVDAIYHAPLISDTEKIEDADQIQDLIYVFVDVNGETQYKAFSANLNTQAGDFNAELTFEKYGLETYKTTHTFNQGSLSGSVYFMFEDEYFDPSGVKVTLKGTLPDADSTEINLETYTEDGYFFFENLGETGEDVMDKIEMEVSGNVKHMYKKVYQHADDLDKRTEKYGSNNLSVDYKKVADEFFDHYADANFEDAEKHYKALRMAAFSLYFLEYYARKADESMENFTDYFKNILKDTLGLVQGLMNFTNGMYEAAEGKNTVMSKVVTKWSTLSGGESKAQRIAKNVFGTVMDALKQGVNSDSAAVRRTMSNLSELIGGLEQLFFGEGVNVLEASTSKLVTMFNNYQKRNYLNDVSKIVKKYKIDLNKIPENLENNIKRAENGFKSNTEKHDYRNALQYEWDVDTAALNEFINVIKPIAKIGITYYTANPAFAHKAVDAAGHAFNALKVAASANHTYEWYVLYGEDVHDLENSFSIMFTGSTIADVPHVPTKLPVKYDYPSGTVYAEAPRMMMSDALYNVSIAFEEGDEKALENYLEELEELREGDTAVREKNVESLEDLYGAVDAKQTEKVIEAQALNSEFDFETDLMELQIVALAIDDSAENISAFRDNIDEFAVKEEEVHAKTNDVFENLELKKSEGDDNMIAYTIVVISMVLFLVVLYLAFRKFKAGKNKEGVITFLAGLIIAFVLFVIGAMFYEEETAEPEKEQTETTEVDVEEEVASDDVVGGLIDDFNEDIEENPEPPEDYMLGKLIDIDHDFTIDVGEENIDKFKVVSTPFEGVVDALLYCVEVSDSNYYEEECGDGYMGIFGIMVMDDEQFDEFTSDEFYDDSFYMGENNGEHFYFIHPNGELPEEVYPISHNYDNIIDSLEFISL